MILICHNNSVNKNYERTKAMNTITVKNLALHTLPAKLRAPRRSSNSRVLLNVCENKNVIV